MTAVVGDTNMLDCDPFCIVAGLIGSLMKGVRLALLLPPAERGWVHILSGWAAGLALVAALGGWLGSGVPRRRDAAGDRGRPFITVCHVLALFASVSASVLIVILLATRGVYTLLETLHGAPLEQREWIGFGPDGLLPIGMLIVATLVTLASTRSPRLITPLYWLATVAVFWTCLLWPTYYRTGTGGYTRSPALLALAGGLALVLCAAVAARSLWMRWRRERRLGADPLAGADSPADWPGLRTSCGALAVFLALLVCYGLVVPVDLPVGGHRLAALMLFLASATGAAALFVVVGWRWNVNLADIAMGLTTLALCALLTALVPSEPAALADRFPMVFNAIVVALAAATGFWTWTSGVWEQQLDQGRAWTTTGHLVKPANRFSFRMGTMGLVVAWLMAVWPKLRPIGATDDSPARMGLGIAAHFLLLLAVLWSGRKTGRSSFRVLGAFTLTSLLVFIGVRAIG